MKLIRVEQEEALKLIRDEQDKIYPIFLFDLENNIPKGKKRLKASEAKQQIRKAQTVILNMDEGEEDSYSILYLYSMLQSDIFNIKCRGLKSDLVIFNN